MELGHGKKEDQRWARSGGHGLCSRSQTTEERWEPRNGGKTEEIRIKTTLEDWNRDAKESAAWKVLDSRNSIPKTEVDSWRKSLSQKFQWKGQLECSKRLSK
jgi:hypothetical protein